MSLVQARFFHVSKLKVDRDPDVRRASGRSMSLSDHGVPHGRLTVARQLLLGAVFSRADSPKRGSCWPGWLTHVLVDFQPDDWAVRVMCVGSSVPAPTPPLAREGAWLAAPPSAGVVSCAWAAACTHPRLARKGARPSLPQSARVECEWWAESGEGATHVQHVEVVLATVATSRAATVEAQVSGLRERGHESGCGLRRGTRAGSGRNGPWAWTPRATLRGGAVTYAAGTLPCPMVV